MAGRRSFFIVFLLCSLEISALAQKGIASDRSLSTLSMNQWTGTEGLMSNNLTSVNQSSDKFIWITNFNGFLRFDGSSFKFYDKATLPFLNTSSFYETFEDSKGTLWFASQSSGILKLVDNTFVQVLPQDKKSLSVRCIAEDILGNIWVGTNNEGIYVLKNTVLEKFDGGDLRLQNVTDILADAKGNMWIATGGDGLLKYSNGKFEQLTDREGLNHNTVNRLELAPDGTIYGGTVNGVFAISQNEVQTMTPLNSLEINDILVDDFRNMWLATEQGLYKYQLDSHKLDSLTDATGLPGSQVSTIHFDHENSLWLSTKKAGLIRLRDGFFDNHTTADGLTSNNVNIIVPHEGKLYVGCDDGRISIIHNDRITQFKGYGSHSKQGIRDILFDANGDMYVASYHGLSMIRDGMEKAFDFKKYGAANDVRRIIKSSAGDLWIATRSGGAIRYSGADSVVVYNSKRGLESDYILAIEEGKNGDIYIGTHSGGLSVISRGGEISNYAFDEGISGMLIFNIEILPDNTLLAATNAGLYIFENQKFKKIHLEQNIKIEAFFDVIIDVENVWISTNIGLIRLNLNDVRRQGRGEIDHVHGKILDRHDGMTSEECTGATRMSMGPNGEILIPTLGGVAILDTREVVENTRVPNVFITEFIVDGVSANMLDSTKTVIEPGAVRYEFNFTALSYIAPPKVRFKYKLSRIDADWVDTNERSVFYTNLPPGNYTFSVIAANNDGVWNNTGSTVRFRVQPYLYQMKSFWVAMVSLVGIIVWFVVRWRIRSVERVNRELRKLNEELDRFVYSASHDLKAPLSSVLGLVEIARLEKTMEGKELCLTMIRDSVHKLDGFIKDIIDYSRNQRVDVAIEKVNIRAIVEGAFTDLKYLDSENYIEKKIICDDDRHFLTDGKRLSIVMKNLVSNAIRYHDLDKTDRFIKVEIQYKAEKALIVVSDNGIGIDSSHIENIFKMFYRADENSSGSGLGLYIVKESIEKLKGTIQVDSTPKVGTAFTITIPSLRPIN